MPLALLALALGWAWVASRARQGSGVPPTKARGAVLVVDQSATRHVYAG